MLLETWYNQKGLHVSYLIYTVNKARMQWIRNENNMGYGEHLL